MPVLETGLDRRAPGSRKSGRKAGALRRQKLTAADPDIAAGQVGLEACIGEEAGRQLQARPDGPLDQPDIEVAEAELLGERSEDAALEDIASIVLQFVIVTQSDQSKPVAIAGAPRCRRQIEILAAEPRDAAVGREACVALVAQTGLEKARQT